MTQTRAATEAATKRAKLSGLEGTMYKFMDKLPAAVRLYPDLYVEDLAERVRAYDRAQNRQRWPRGDRGPSSVRKRR